MAKLGIVSDALRVMTPITFCDTCKSILDVFFRPFSFFYSTKLMSGDQNTMKKIPNH